MVIRPFVVASFIKKEMFVHLLRIASHPPAHSLLNPPSLDGTARTSRTSPPSFFLACFLSIQARIWSDEEVATYITGLRMHGRDMEAITEMLAPSKTETQIRGWWNNYRYG